MAYPTSAPCCCSPTARHNTIKGVAREFKVSEQTMSAWFRQLGLHTRSSLPAMSIPQDLSMGEVTTDTGWSGDFEDEDDDDEEDDFDDDDLDDLDDDDGDEGTIEQTAIASDATCTQAGASTQRIQRQHRHDSDSRNRRWHRTGPSQRPG